MFSGCVNILNIKEGFIIPENVKNMSETFFKCTKLEGTLVLKANPETFASAFAYVGEKATNGIVVNYTSTCTNIDDVIATKTENAKVTKGALVE